MKFLKTVNILLEEFSAEKPKLEPLTPDRYTRVYMERDDDRKLGDLAKVDNVYGYRIYKQINKNSEEVIEIKKEWRKVYLRGGGAIAGRLTPEELDSINRELKDVYGEDKLKTTLNDYYIVRDDIFRELFKTEHHYRTEWWLEPHLSNYTSKEVSNTFSDLMDSL
jgi:hypothetical protein